MLSQGDISHGGLAAKLKVPDGTRFYEILALYYDQVSVYSASAGLFVHMCVTMHQCKLR